MLAGGAVAHRRDVHDGELLRELLRVLRVVLLVAGRQVLRQLCGARR